MGGVRAKIGLDRIDFICYTGGIMKQNYSFGDGVKQEVMALIKRRVCPGDPVSKKDLKIAYSIVRANAIADTLFWKRLHITIEDTHT